MQDLRTFLAILEQAGDLKRIKRQVNPKHEVAAVMKRSAEQSGPALLFENVMGSKIPLAANVVAGRHRVAHALGTGTEDLLETYRQRLLQPIQPVKVNGTGQPEKISGGLSSLPIITLSERDSGPYITAGVIFAAHPQSGKINLSFQRMSPRSDNEVAIFVGETSDLWEYGKATGFKTLPVAVAIGLHPAFFLVAGTRFPPDAEEIALVGALLGEPVRLTRSSRGQWIIPEAAEIVLEGEIDFENTVPEGPFGEYTGYYGAGTLQARLSPVLRFNAIAGKKNPIFQTVITGPGPGYESAHLSPLSKEAMLYARLSKLYPNVKRVSLSMGRYIAAVQVDEDFPDDLAKTVMNEVFDSSYYIKYVVLVDLDVDITDPRDVLWAMSTRVDPGQRMYTFHGKIMETLDPSTEGRCDKVGFDARKPKGELEGFIRTRIPGVEKIRIEDYYAR